VFGLAIQPLRHEFDSDRQPRHQLSFAAIGATIPHRLGGRGCAAMPYDVLLRRAAGDLRLLLVNYLSAGMGYSLTAAGSVFAGPGDRDRRAHRLGLDRQPLGQPRLVLGGSASRWLASLAVAAIGLGSPAGRLAVAVCYSATAVGWHNCCWRRWRAAPPGRIGAITGGVVAFGGAGMMTYPLLHAGLLHLTGAYGWGFALGAFPAAVVGWRLVRGARRSA
jgi:hypothetical protein